jgi:hypothetical protein
LVGKCDHCRAFDANCDACMRKQKFLSNLTCTRCLYGSPSWFHDPTHPGGKLCVKCYMTKNKCRIDTHADGLQVIRTCVSCCALKSSSWYREMKRPGTYICKQCYNHRYQSRLEVQPDGSIKPRTCNLFFT